MSVSLTLLLCFISFNAASSQRLSVSGTHFVRGGHRVFLSGANSAWDAYGYDFGNHQYAQRRQTYLTMLDQVSKAGGNSMRTWVFIHGATTPHFDSNGFVIGLDSDGSFLSDFKQYLDDAHARNVLIFPTLWNGAVVHDFPERLKGLITDTAKLQSFLDKALIPWVKAVKDHPALGGWDIINEIEGFIKTGEHNAEPCFDTQFLSNSGAGWAGQIYTAHELQRFINWQADAIRRTDPGALVTAGSSSQKSFSDKFGDKNLYKDDCLRKAGGKALGTLTFYSTHSYSWQGQYASDAVFKHDVSDYGLNKPVVIAEFSQVSGAGLTSAQQFTWAYEHGYAGAWSWMMKTPGGDGSDTPAVQEKGMEAIRTKNDQTKGGLVAFKL